MSVSDNSLLLGENKKPRENLNSTRIEFISVLNLRNEGIVKFDGKVNALKTKVNNLESFVDYDYAYGMRDTVYIGIFYLEPCQGETTIGDF